MAGWQSSQALEDLFKEDKHDTGTGIWFVWVCDLAGDATLKAVTTDSTPTGPKTARLIGVLAEWLAKGEKSALDTRRIDAILEEMRSEVRPNTEAVVGLFLDRHRNSDEAARYLKQADSDRCNLWIRFLVRSARKARGAELPTISR